MFWDLMIPRHGLFVGEPGAEGGSGGGGGEAPPADPPSDPGEPANTEPDGGGGEPSGDGGDGGTKPTEPEGGFTWREKLLGEDLAEDPLFAPYEDSEEGLKNLIKSYKGQARLLGGEKVPVPKDENDKDAWDALYKVIGRPDEPDGYDLSFLNEKEYPEGFGPNIEMMEALKPVAHELGLNQRQLQGLSEFVLQQQEQTYTQLVQEQNQRHEAAMAALQQEWGKATPQKIQAANSALAELTAGMGEDDKARIVNAMGNDPAFIKMLAKYREAVAEDTLKGDGQHRGVMTSQEAKRAIARIKGDPKHPYHHRDHPEHAAAVEDMARLFEAAYPEEAMEA